MNMPLPPPSGSRKRQQGVVLVVSLLMLLVLTLVGLAATRSTTLEERMTANQNDATVAFQAAEAALRDGEGQLSGASQPNFSSNTAGAYMAAGAPDWRSVDWKSTSAVKAYGGGITPTPAFSPSYFIVQTNYYTTTTRNPDPTQALDVKYIFYIYAHGYGVTGNSEVVLQSAYQE